jgi:hypothetical protein
MSDEFERKSSRTEDDLVRGEADRKSARDSEGSEPEVEGHLRVNHGGTERSYEPVERKA